MLTLNRIFLMLSTAVTIGMIVVWACFGALNSMLLAILLGATFGAGLVPPLAWLLSKPAPSEFFLSGREIIDACWRLTVATVLIFLLALMCVASVS